MKKFPYIHHPSEKLLLLVEAESIMEADKIFEAAFGIKPEKLSSVGCRIVGEYPGEAVSIEEAKALLGKSGKN